MATMSHMCNRCHHMNLTNCDITTGRVPCNNCFNLINNGHPRHVCAPGFPTSPAFAGHGLHNGFPPQTNSTELIAKLLKTVLDQEAVIKDLRERLEQETRIAELQAQLRESTEQSAAQRERIYHLREATLLRNAADRMQFQRDPYADSAEPASGAQEVVRAHPSKVEKRDDMLVHQTPGAKTLLQQQIRTTPVLERRSLRHSDIVQPFGPASGAGRNEESNDSDHRRNKRPRQTLSESNSPDSLNKKPRPSTSGNDE